MRTEMPNRKKPVIVLLRFRLLSLDAKTCDKRAIKSIGCCTAGESLPVRLALLCVGNFESHRSPPQGTHLDFEIELAE